MYGESPFAASPPSAPAAPAESFFLRGSQLFPRRRARLRLRGGDSGGGRRVCARGVRVLKSLQRQHRGLAHDLALVLARGPERFRALVRRDRPERLRGLVPHHAVVARVLENLLQLRHRASGLHLTQRERDLVPEQRARVLQAVQQRVHGRVASDASQREERAEPPRDGHGRVKELRAEVRDAHLRRDRAATRAGIAVRSERARARSGGRRDVSLCQSACLLGKFWKSSVSSERAKQLTRGRRDELLSFSLTRWTAARITGSILGTLSTAGRSRHSPRTTRSNATRSPFPTTERGSPLLGPVHGPLPPRWRGFLASVRGRALSRRPSQRRAP